jgi:hypothetical protein
MSKFWVKMKVLVKCINIGHVCHVQNWCIMALVNVS